MMTVDGWEVYYLMMTVEGWEGVLPDDDSGGLGGCIT